MTDIASILDKAADLIEPEGAWTQNAMARGKSGRPVIHADSATCFCIMGAINAASGLRMDYPTPSLPYREVRNVCRRIVGSWNDAPGRTQAEAIQALRTAAAQARAKVEDGE